MPAPVNPPSFNLLLQPEFPMNALILASDALRIANQNSGRELFEWRFVSGDGGPVRASNRMWLTPDCALENMPRADVYLLFEGNLPTQNNSPLLLHHLRAAARFGAIVGGIDTGSFALAQAGIAAVNEDQALTLHWEAVPAFQERFPDSLIKDQIYLAEGNRVHCAGGVATLDLMLDLISRFAGEALANEVANALVHERRLPSSRQRSDTTMVNRQSALSARILAVLEANLDFPLSQPEIARHTGLSERSLSRFCQRHFGISPMRLYLRIRLQAARNLLFYEEFSVKDVANACGFSFPAVFSRSFKAQFGQSPREFRNNLRATQSAFVRPEIHRLISPNSRDPSR